MAIKVKAIIGSTSSTSYNLKLVEYMRNRYADRLDIVPVLINDLEMFSIDIVQLILKTNRLQMCKHSKMM